MKQTLKTLTIALLTLLAVASCTRENPFVTVQDGHFVRHGKPYEFIGTNFWYGPILASDGEGGDMARLRRELDTLKAIGIENLRVLVGGDGPDGVYSRVTPTLQKAPGVYNDTLLTGLDRFLVELGKRDMQAVLYMNNSWEWSGGYSLYLEWAGAGPALIPLIDGYGPFMQQMGQFSTNDAAQELFFDHVRTIVGRTNSVTGKPYSEDPAIFSWQIGNEPRCFTDDPDARDRFVGWLAEAASIIKGIDPNHMVSTGNEGIMGCEASEELFEKVNAIPDVDYITIHIWPYNWGWVRAESLGEDIGSAIGKTTEYVEAHARVSRALGKPVVAEEFGFPRDGFLFGKDDPTTARDFYYKHVFSLVGNSCLAGANFWGWSGFAEPSGEEWHRGDPYTGDPAQEAQGLNGVYVTDSTIEIINNSISNLNQ